MRQKPVCEGLLALPAEVPAAFSADPGFVPIHADPALLPAAPAAAPAPAPVSPPAIEVEVAGAVIRVLPGMDVALLTSVPRAVRALAGAG